MTLFLSISKQKKTRRVTRLDVCDSHVLLSVVLSYSAHLCCSDLFHLSTGTALLTRAPPPSRLVPWLVGSELSDCRGGKNLVFIQQSVIGDTHGLLEAETRALMGPAAAPGDFGERVGGGMQNAVVTRRTVFFFLPFTLLSKRQGVVVRNLSCMFVISCGVTVLDGQRQMQR